MVQNHILLIEDDPAVLSINTAALEKSGYAVASADTLQKARECIKKCPPDLIVLDIIMPDGSGLAFCREIRDTVNAPVLFLTVKNRQDEIVDGLVSGGDDYMTKPYNTGELCARVAAHLRREQRTGPAKTRSLPGGLTLDVSAQRALYNGYDLLLKPKEFLLFSALAREMGKYINVDELYREVWGMDARGDTRTVKVHLSTLRGKLKDAGISYVQIEHDAEKGYCMQVASLV